MRRAPNPFAPPAPDSELARGCLVALATAGGAVLAAAGFCFLVAGSYQVAHALAKPRPATWSAPAAVPAAAPVPAAARRLWGEIRARYRLKDLSVPA